MKSSQYFFRGCLSLLVVLSIFALSDRALASFVAMDALSVGHKQTCSVAVDDKPICWGLGTSGQLGYGSNDDRIYPTYVTTQTGFIDIATAESHTCGISNSLDGNKLYCWGNGGEGKLGDGNTDSNSTTPVAVISQSGFIDVELARSHSCAISDASDGNLLYCWGYNQYGQVGVGSLGQKRTTPVAVSTQTGFIDVSLGYQHTCALSDAADGNRVYCWGSNDYGQLGDNSTSKSLVPVLVDTQTGFVQIDTLFNHTCAISDAADGGRAYCWGLNDYSQLGDGLVVDSSVPVLVDTQTGFVSISTGQSHTCAISDLAYNSEVYCWGRNNSGQLGDGSQVDSAVPVSVAGDLGFSSISLGELHTCGIRDGAGSQKIYCWGNNGEGQLGIGNTSTRLTPQEIKYLTLTVPSNTQPFLSQFSPYYSSGGVATNAVLSVQYSDNDGDAGDLTFAVYDADPLDCSSPDGGANVVGSLINVTSVSAGAIVSTSALSLSGATEYFWCASANDGTVTTYSSPLSFTTLGANTSPSLSLPSPADAATDVAIDTTLSIDYVDTDSDAGDLVFTVYDANPTDCSSPSGANVVGSALNVNGVTAGTSGTTGALTLDNATEYFWCVSGDDLSNPLVYAGPYSFTTIAGAESGPAAGTLESIAPTLNTTVFDVVDIEGTTDVFGDAVPAGVSLTPKTPGAIASVCNIHGVPVDITFIVPGVSVDVHCDDESFYIGNATGPFAASFRGVDAKPSEGFAGKDGFGMTVVLPGAEILGIDPPGTWIFAMDGVDDFVMNPGKSNEFNVSFSGATDFIVRTNIDGSQNVIVESGSVTLTDTDGGTIVIDGGVDEDGDAEVAYLSFSGSLGGVTVADALTGGDLVGDADGDGVNDDTDNCPSVANPLQEPGDCGFTGAYAAFNRGNTDKYRTAAFDKLTGRSHSQALSATREDKTAASYLREMVKRAAGQSTEIRAAAAAANALLGLTGADELDDTDGSDDNLYTTLRKIRQWRFENR